MKKPLPYLLTTLLLLISATAAAQVAVQKWRPSTEAGGFVVLEPPSAPMGYGFGTTVWLQYAREPVVLPLDKIGEEAIVTDQYTLDISSTVGLFDWLALSLAVPATIYQGSGTPEFGVSSAGLGDPRLLAKLTLLRPDPRGHGVGISLLPELGLPFGDRRGLLGDRNFTFTPRASFGYLAGPVLLVANAGYRFREGAPVGELLVDDEIMGALGAEVPIPHLPLTSTLEIAAATAAQRPFLNLKETSVEAFGSMRAKLGPIALQPGLAVGLTPGYLVPDFRFFLAVAYAPRYRDADGDGITDTHDQCVEEREDVDGHRDHDGCADVDNDGDGVFDRVDRCPDLPGPDMSAGCP